MPSTSFSLLLASAVFFSHTVTAGTSRANPFSFGPTARGQSTKLADDSGGSVCAGCAIVVGLVDQLSQLYNSSVDHALERLCNYLPGEIKPICKRLIEVYGAAVIEFLESKETPDLACHAIGLCKMPAAGDMCHIFPLPPSQRYGNQRALSKHIYRLRRRARAIADEVGSDSLSDSLETDALPNFCDWPVFSEICKIVERWTDEHLPVDDVDKDRFSDLPTARGSSWRGKDCDDISKDTYPGRRPRDGDRVLDSNCNGISGMDRETGRSYEEMWCNGTQQFGIVVMGDSIGAHFHIPPAWLNVTEMNEAVFQHAIFALTNELDWPQLSMTTGHFNASRWSPAIQGPMDSFYQRMVDINRCNHRDFQNIGVNGARSSSMAEHIVQTLARDHDNDQPVMMIFELIGNDVCNGHPGTSHMTTPEEFYTEQLKSLRYIDAHLPKGSHITLVGLADGRVLFNNMHDRVHPLGALRNNVKYSDFYTYLNCLGVSPCWGWMNTNETARNITTERAFLLNEQLERIAKTEHFENFDTYYTAYDIEAAAAIWAKQGGELWQLIEPVDGFHANQIGNALGTQVFWNKVMEDRPGWLPSANPHNNDIVQHFKDQGGY